MKKYILYTLLLVFAANIGYSQDRKAIEAAKKRLLELRAQKAQIEEEMQEILQPDKIVTTEIKDGVRTETVEIKEDKTLSLPIDEVISREEERTEGNIGKLTEDKISRREQRKQKRAKNTSEIVDNKKEETKVTIEKELPESPAIEIVEETQEEVEIVEPKLSRRERRRQRDIENADIEIETPEEIEVVVEPEVPETPAIEIVEETQEEVEIPEPKLTRRERRRQRDIENADIEIEEPEEIEVTVELEEPSVEMVVGENVEIELSEDVASEQPEIPEIEEEVEVVEQKLTRRERRLQRDIENTDIVIEVPEEIVEENDVTIEPQRVEEPEIEIVEKEQAVKPEKSKAVVPKVEPKVEEMVMETPSTPKVEVNIQSTEFEVEDAPQLEIEAKMPEIEIPPVVEEEAEERPVKLSRRERRKLRQTENFGIKIETPEETPEIEVVEEKAPETSPQNGAVTVVKDPEEEAIIAEIENAADQKTRLSIDVVNMPGTEPFGVRLSDEASLAMTDILTATPPESVPPEVTFYDAKLKLIVGEMEALVSRSALLPSGMKRINDKLSTIESQLLKFDDMRSEPETAKYMNFMQMNIDILQNITGDSNANAPDAMLMEPEENQPPIPTPASTPASAPQGAQKVYFMRDSDDIGFRFKKELEALAATAKDIPGFYLIIDSMDESLQNELVISENRAENIREFLQKEGVGDEQIRSRYFGNTPDELTVEPAMIIQIVDN